MKNMKTPYLIMAAAVLVIAVVPSLYFYMRYRAEVRKDSPEVAQAELKSIKTKIEKHIELPQTEEPVLATVSDIEKLKSQTFFSRSENGDKVLIFPVARKAYLYRPSTDKLIEVATLNIDAEGELPTASGTPAASPSPTPATP